MRAVQEPGPNGRKWVALDKHASAIVRHLREHPDTRLIVVDPISAYMGNVDARKNAEVRGALVPIAAMAATGRVAVVCLTHLNKSVQTPKVLYRLMDSIAFGAVARAVLGVFPDRKDPGDERRLFLHVKMNLVRRPPGLAYRIKEAEPGIPKIEWEPTAVSTKADDALAAETAPAERKTAREKRRSCWRRCSRMARYPRRRWKNSRAAPAFQKQR